MAMDPYLSLSPTYTVRFSVYLKIRMIFKCKHKHVIPLLQTPHGSLLLLYKSSNFHHDFQHHVFMVSAQLSRFSFFPHSTMSHPYQTLCGSSNAPSFPPVTLLASHPMFTLSSGSLRASHAPLLLLLPHSSSFSSSANFHLPYNLQL